MQNSLFTDHGNGLQLEEAQPQPARRARRFVQRPYEGDIRQMRAFAVAAVMIYRFAHGRLTRACST